MTVAEIVKELLRKDYLGVSPWPWSSHDYEKAWLAIGYLEFDMLSTYWHHIAHSHLAENPVCHKEHASGFKEFKEQLLDKHHISPSDYAELERRIKKREER